MKAMDVFAISIRHLKDNMLKKMNSNVTSDFFLKDIEFVLTVPAIWGDTAKMFMREAAIKVSSRT